MGELAGERLVELALALDAGAEQQAGEALGQQESSRSRGCSCQAWPAMSSHRVHQGGEQAPCQP